MDVVFYLLKSAAILAIFYFVYIVLLRKETHFKAHRLYLLIGVVASFIFPFLYFTNTVYIDVVANSGPSFSSSEMIPATATAVAQTTTPIDWWQLFLTVYLIGASLVLFKFLKDLISLLILLNANKAIKNKGFRYIQVSEKIAPFSFFSYIVYNPQLHSDEELKMILKHEQAHAFHWHSADIIIANLLVMIQWMNPLAWLYKKSVEENLEFLADNATAATVPSKKDYQLALVKASSAYYTPALTTNFYKSFIKKRIIMLNKSTSKRHNLLKLAAVLPFIAFFLWSFNVKEAIIYNELPAIPEPIQSEVTYSQGEDIVEELPKKVKDKIIEGHGEAGSKKNIEENPVVTPVVPSQGVEEPNRSMANSQNKDFKYKINKNTSDAEMKRIMDELKRDHNIDLNYDIVRNSNNEITSITLQYTGRNRNGNYSINDDEGIEEFYFYMEGDESGFWSERAEERRAARAYQRAERMKNMEDRNEDIIVEREEMRGELAEKRKLMRDDMRLKRKELFEERKEHKDLLRKEKGVAKKYKITRSADSDDENEIFVISGDDERATIFRDKDRHRGDRTIVVKKDTSDSDLAKMKEQLAAKGIDFSYKKLKRNSKGEITRIHITVDNNKGSRQTIVSEADDGDPIDTLNVNID